jgi:hypothetical protein
VNDLRAAMSTWLTLALDEAMPATSLDADLARLRDWIDGGCVGDMPLPADRTPVLADEISTSIRVAWETRKWTPAQFRRALVAERLR